MWQYNLEIKVRQMLTGKFSDLAEASAVLLKTCEYPNGLHKHPDSVHYISDDELAWLEWFDAPATLHVRLRQRSDWNNPLRIYIPCEVKK